MGRGDALYKNAKYSADEVARGAVHYPRPSKKTTVAGSAERLAQMSREATPLGFQVKTWAQVIRGRRCCAVVSTFVCVM